MATALNSDEFLLKPNELQLQWIEENVPDWGVLLYGEGYLGCSYPTENINLNEYLSNRDDYGVTEMLLSQDSNIAEERIEEIDSGADLTTHEIEMLQRSIAEDDFDGWIGHHCFELELSDGKVCMYFEGHDIGQGGFDFKYVGTFESRELILKHVETKPFFALEIHD